MPSTTRQMTSEPLSCWTALRADTFRQYGHSTAGALIRGFCTRRTFRAVATLRLCQAAASGYPWRLTLPLCKLAHRVATRRAGMELPWRSQIGAGIALTHGWGLVVNEGARIGHNVTLFHGVTLGRRDRIAATGERLTEYPTIEDEVWVGPHAVIVGGVTIGTGSRIAAGAFVTTDIPAHSVVQGNPACIIKQDCVPDVMNRVEL